MIAGSKIATVPDADANVIYWKAQELSDIVLKFLADPAGFQGEAMDTLAGQTGRS